MNKLYLFLLVALFGAVSCVNDSDEFNADSYDDNFAFVSSEEGVSLKQAIGNADFIYKDIEGGKYKKRNVESVNLLTSSNFNRGVTRSNAEDEPLVYVVNYENDGGYAILAATEKLPPVIMLGDEGSFSTEQFLDYVNDETKLSDEDAITSANEMQYILVNNSLVAPPAGLFPPASAITVDTTMILKCLPLVKTKWNQGAPYNKFAPLDSSGNICLAGCVPVASAQTLAALCYHHNFRPTIDIHPDYPVNWRKISYEIYSDIVKYSYNDNTSGSNEVANLIRAIGAEIDADYGADATSGYPSKIADLYEKLGMTYVELLPKQDVTNDMLFDMIVDKNYPVECSAGRYDEEDEVSRHYFNIDGWLRLEYTSLNFEVEDYTQPAVTNPTQTQFDLVHVNFGWGGSSDGYYLPGAFNISSSAYDQYYEENDIVNNTNRNYNLSVKYMLYNL